MAKKPEQLAMTSNELVAVMVKAKKDFDNGKIDGNELSKLSFWAQTASPIVRQAEDVYYMEREDATDNDKDPFEE